MGAAPAAGGAGEPAVRAGPAAARGGEAACGRTGEAAGGAGGSGGSRRRRDRHHRSPMEAQPIPLAGSDAERRAHLRLAARLRDGGREVAVETCWVHPRGQLAHALHAGLGVVASVVAVGAPAVGLGLALAALLSLLLDLSGRIFLLRRLTPERATENVVAVDPRRAVAAPPDPAARTAAGGEADSGGAAGGGAAGGGAAGGGAAGGGAAAALRLVLTAHCDAPRGGLLRRLPGRRGGGRPAGWPPPFAWAALALLAVAGCTAARLAGVDADTAIGVVQLVPTLVLLGAVGLLVDAALADPLPAEPLAAEAVVAAARALDAAPPRMVAVDVVIAGAGEAQALGFLAWLRRRRPARDGTVVVELTAADGPPRWWSDDAALLPLRYHPRLVALAAAASDQERALGAGPARGGRTLGAALRARQRRLPAIRLSAGDRPAAVALLLALAETLDDDLQRRAGAGSGR